MAALEKCMKLNADEVRTIRELVADGTYSLGEAAKEPTCNDEAPDQDRLRRAG